MIAHLLNNESMITPETIFLNNSKFLKSVQ